MGLVLSWFKSRLRALLTKVKVTIANRKLFKFHTRLLEKIKKDKKIKVSIYSLKEKKNNRIIWVEIKVAFFFVFSL